jgi:transcriptional regulator with XRE-family HTH domain
VRSIHSALYKHFIKGLREQREARGVTQEQLARRLRAGQSFVSKVERGERRIDIAEFVEIARSIGVDPVLLFRKLAESFEMSVNSAKQYPRKRDRL